MKILILFLLLAACSGSTEKFSEPLNNPPPPEFAPYAMPGKIAPKSNDASAAPSSSKTMLVSGKIVIQKDLLKKQSPPQTLFLILRHPNGGPPVAAKKMQAANFPVSFVVGTENLMIPGTQIPESFILEARLDRDGSAGKPQSGDWIGLTRSPVNKGQTQVQVVIDQIF